MRKGVFAQNSIIPDQLFPPEWPASEYQLKIRHSDEDARQIWKMMTSNALQLSLPYVGKITLK